MFEGFLWFLTQNIKNVAVGNCLERGSPVKKHLAGDFFEPSVHDLLSHSSQVSAIVLSMKHSLQF